MRVGNDTLGAVRYEKAMLDAQVKGDCGGIFLTTFGDAIKTLRKMCRSGLWSEIVVHIAPFDYGHKYDLKRNLPIVYKWCPVLEKLQNKFPDTKLIPSPFCENNHKRATMEPIFKRMRELAPSCEFVNSIWQGDEVPGTITEIHLIDSKLIKRPKNPVYTVAFDGFGGDGTGDMPDADIDRIMRAYADARHIRAWNFRYNGKYGHADPEKNLAKRKHWPTANYLRTHRDMLKFREGAATWTASLLKPVADDHGGVEPTKDYKFMVIANRPGQSLKLYDKAGNVIDTLIRQPGDHTGKPKGGRFYSKLCANQIADRARKNTGSALVRIEGEGFTDANLRSGFFR